MPIHDTKVGTRTPRDGTGPNTGGPAHTANTPNQSRCAMSLPAVVVEPPAGRAKTPKGIPIEKGKEEVATEIARALASIYCQYADPERKLFGKMPTLGKTAHTYGKWKENYPESWIPSLKI